MSKKYAVFITALFCLFLFGFGAAFWLLPDKEFSEQENTYLAQLPELKLGQLDLPGFLQGGELFYGGNLFSGKFMEDFEEYAAEQFPLRDWWIRVKARAEKTVGKLENNKVYFGADEQTLFAHYTAPDDLATRVGYVNELGTALEIPVFFSLIPDKSYVWADRLPANAPNVDDGSTLAQAAALCSGDVTWIDLSDALDGKYSFYRTDHHWSTHGAYQGYMVLAGALNSTYTTPPGAAALVSTDFYGTTYSSAGAGWIEPDHMYTWVDEDTVEVTRYPEGAPVAGELYDESWLDKKDKYSLFLGGNQPLCILRNENAATDKKLLVVRDSYSDSLAPFLAQDYQEVHLIDLRYYKAPLPAYVQANGIDQALVLYSAANFSTDSNLFILGMG